MTPNQEKWRELADRLRSHSQLLHDEVAQQEGESIELLKELVTIIAKDLNGTAFAIEMLITTETIK